MRTTGLKFLMAVAFVTGVAACNPTHGTPRPTQSVEIAREVCEVTALAEEHRTLTTRVGSIESGAPTNMRDESWTILMEKLRQYRAEIDATYRFVTSNCTTFNLCMQSHHYNEADCAGSRIAWTDSYSKFNQLALDLARLEQHHPRPSPGAPGTPPSCSKNCGSVPPSDCRAVKCNVQGAVFSTGCCYDGD